MKLTNRDIYFAHDSMQTLLETKMPVAVSFRLVRTAQEVKSALLSIDQVRLSIVKKYGDEDEGGTITVPQGTARYVSFVEEFDELLDLEVELDIEQVVLPEELEIEPSVLMALERFVEAPNGTAL